jgi:hypothetical protein
MKTYLEYSEIIITDTPSSGGQIAAELKTKLIPRGNFAGRIYQLGLVKDGEPIACDTGDQGGGQN